MLRPTARDTAFASNIRRGNSGIRIGGLSGLDTSHKSPGGRADNGFMGSVNRPNVMRTIGHLAGLCTVWSATACSSDYSPVAPREVPSFYSPPPFETLLLLQTDVGAGLVTRDAGYVTQRNVMFYSACGELRNKGPGGSLAYQAELYIYGPSGELYPTVAQPVAYTPLEPAVTRLGCGFLATVIDEDWRQRPVGTQFKLIVFGRFADGTEGNVLRAGPVRCDGSCRGAVVNAPASNRREKSCTAAGCSDRIRHDLRNSVFERYNIVSHTDLRDAARKLDAGGISQAGRVWSKRGE
jgi:hypothetical protein